MEIQNNNGQATPLGEQINTPLTTLVPSPHKMHKGVIWIIVIGLVVAVGSFIYFFALPKQSLNSRFINPNPVKKQPPSNNVKYNNDIAQICSQEKKPVGNYAPGEIILKFKDSYSVTQIKKYLADNNYKTADTYSINEPTEVLVMWTNSFQNQNAITIEEVNAFLGKARQEIYIQNIEISSFWHDWPLTKDRENVIQRIDRWGYFTLTFSDPSKEKEFFQKFPEATFYGYGEIMGQSLHKDTNVYKVTILYKTGSALDILQAVKIQAKLQDFPTEKQVTSPGATSQRQIIFLDDRKRDPTDTTYVSNLGINFSSNYDNAQIGQMLDSYSTAIDTQQTLPEERLDYFTIQVPTGEEECWARELEKENEIESAMPNILLSPF